jgi:NADH-quinone oxidoreductase subunit G
MLKVKIDNIEIEVHAGTTVIQACELAGVEIPHFCYHERLEIAGNCRMCLVEIEKMPKPVPSCVQAVTDGMVVKTKTPMVKKAREGVMEFLLINHPLDCPICDQGGECDLQDQAMKYGRGEGQYHEHKRAVKDKYMGPLVATHMTRCIHCTRCIRFLEDVAGVPELGALGRGEDMEVGTYIEKGLTSELSGNIIDLCPVGALTSKPYEFKARSWELHKTESIDVLDAVGSNIRIDSKGREVMRILPRLNDDINEEWIADKSRFAYDGLKYQRLDRPMLKVDGVLKDSSFDKVFTAIAHKIKKTKAFEIGAVAGDLTDVESMLMMKEMLDMIGCKNYDCRQDGSLLDNSFRSFYTFNTTIRKIEEADYCLIIGSNPRVEAALVNAKIGLSVRKNNLEAAVIGDKVDLTYPYKHLGNNPWILKQLANAEHPHCFKIAKAVKPMLILGADTMSSDDYEATIFYAKQLCKRYQFIKEGWNGYNLLQRSASRVGGLDIGFIPKYNGLATNELIKKCKVIFLLGADEIDHTKISPDAFVVYIGHHGDRGAAIADVVLPAAAYTEKEATYVNLEGRVQSTQRAVFPPGEAQEDWQLIIQLAKYLGVKLPYTKLQDVRNKMMRISPVFLGNGMDIDASFPSNELKQKDFIRDRFNYRVNNYYMTDPISRNSKTMAKCTIEKQKRDLK